MEVEGLITVIGLLTLVGVEVTTLTYKVKREHCVKQGLTVE